MVFPLKSSLLVIIPNKDKSSIKDLLFTKCTNLIAFCCYNHLKKKYQVPSNICEDSFEFRTEKATQHIGEMKVSKVIIYFCHFKYQSKILIKGTMNTERCNR